MVTPRRREAHVEKAFCFLAVKLISRIVGRMDTYDPDMMVRDNAKLNAVQVNIMI